ncbi:MAG: T9SS type A sorting domain-containing protein, partial [Candidatus Delongbacteria bacterium]|nr:T9SS type A sorting domain-containing protein [Candidatus Delongbacteria bacterium]
YWLESDKPPSRSLQFLGSDTDKEVGFQIAYDLDYEDCQNTERIGNVSNPGGSDPYGGAWRVGRTYGKSYPYLFNFYPAKEETKSYEGRIFRGYYDPKEYSDNATSVQFFKIEEGKYQLFVDYHKSVSSDIIVLPEELTGYKITPIDVHNNLSLNSVFVFPEGIEIDVTGDYGYGVFDLELNVDRESISENAYNSILEPCDDGSYNLFIYYDKTFKFDRINLGSNLASYKIEKTESYGTALKYDRVDEYGNTYMGTYIGSIPYNYGVYNIYNDNSSITPTNYFVSTVGSDDKLISYPVDSYFGSEDYPFASIHKAIEESGEGNCVIYVAPGTYGGLNDQEFYYYNTEDYLSWTVEGEYKYAVYIYEKENIEITRDPDYTTGDVIIDGFGLNASVYSSTTPKYSRGRYGFYVRNSRNIKIKDIEVKLVQQCADVTLEEKGSRGDGIILIDSPNCTLENLRIHNCGGMGIAMSNMCENSLIKNCDSFENYDPYTVGKDEYGNPRNDRGQDADGFRYSPSSEDVSVGEGVKFIGCRAWKNSDDGWDLFGCEEQVLIDNCWAFKNGHDPYPSTGTFYGNGIGFKLGPNTYHNPRDYAVYNPDGTINHYDYDEDYSDNPPSHIARNCIAYGNENSGFDINNSFRKQFWYNNCSIDNSNKNFIVSQNQNNIANITNSGWTGNPGTNNFILKNNISYIGSNQFVENDDLIIDNDQNNTWNECFEVTDDDFVNFDNTVDPSVYCDYMTSVSRVNDLLPVLDFFKLDHYSDLVDNGITEIESPGVYPGVYVTKDIYGINPDLGCYENQDLYRYDGIYDDNVLIVEEMMPYTISSGEEYIIANGGSIEANADLIIDSGGKLILLDGAVINAYENSEIKVKDGGFFRSTDATIIGVEQWNGIVSEDGGDVGLTSTSITNAECALSVVNSNGYVLNSTISDCDNGVNLINCNHFMMNGNNITGNNISETIGVSLTQYSTNNTETFNGNTITDFDTGLSIISCSPELTNNVIEDNASYGIFISGYNTFPVLVDYDAIEDDVNNHIIDNGIAQIGMKYAAGVYMDEGWNNIYSGTIPSVPSIPCLLGLSETSKADLPSTVSIPASENYWGYNLDIDATTEDSFFDLYYKYLLDYSGDAHVPYTVQTSKEKNNDIKSDSKELLSKAIEFRNEGKIKQAIDKLDILIKKYSDTNEYYVALYMLPGLYEKQGMSFEPILTFIDEKLKSDDETINKKFHKEMKVHVNMLDENYDEAIKIAEEMKSEATSESEVILSEIDIAIAKLMKNGQKKGKVDYSEVVRNLILELMGYEIEKDSSIDSNIPDKIELYQNYPNPFNPITEIKYALPTDCNVNLKIFNANGRVVADLVKSTMNAGYHIVQFDATKYSSGIFYYQLKVDGNVKMTKKMLMVK